MRKIEIQRNTDGDTRVATEAPTMQKFCKSNDLHRSDVNQMMSELARDINTRGENHDWTKTREPYKSLFYRELCATIEGKMDFDTDSEWYKQHCELERHHLNKRCPEDVNLIDVIEMICDCVCAGMARSGEIRPIAISSEILQMAVENTIKMCANAVLTKDEGEE